MIKKILVLILFLFVPNICYAYLDPGMGSYILAMLAAFFATLVTFFGIITQKVKNLTKKIREFFNKKEK
jgi:hypothetical protein